MWFKSFFGFHVADTFSLNINDLDSKVRKHELRECTSSDNFTFGFTPLIAGTDVWSVTSDNAILLRAAKEEKVVNGTVLKQMVEAKALQISETEGVKVGRKQKADIKDEVLHTLRAKAESKRTYVDCYIDLKSKCFVINSTNASMIENLFKLIQGANGTFPIKPIYCASSPSAVMTEWLEKSSLPASLETGALVKLVDLSEDNPSIEFKKIEPLDERVTRHIEQGMTVSKMAVRFSEKMHFTIDANCVLTKIKFDDTLRDQAFNDSAGGAVADLDASFAIMVGQFRVLFEQLSIWFEIDGERT